jgi:hypothetical protein
MSVDWDAMDVLLKKIGTSRQEISTAVHNSSQAKQRRRRVLNQDDILLDGVDGEVGDEFIVDEAAVGDTVLVQPAAPVEGEIMEIVPEETEMPPVPESEPVANARRYKRINNARIIRNADGSESVVVPVESPAVPPKAVATTPVAPTQNVRRYVARNAASQPRAPKYVPAMPAKDYATILNAEKARRYDELIANANLEQEIDKIIADSLDKHITQNRAQVTNAAPATPKKTVPRIIRTKNFRVVKNADEFEVIIDLGDPTSMGGGAASTFEGVSDTQQVETGEQRLSETPIDAGLDIEDGITTEDGLVVNYRNGKRVVPQPKVAPVATPTTVHNAVLTPGQLFAQQTGLHPQVAVNKDQMVFNDQSVLDLPVIFK